MTLVVCPNLAVDRVLTAGELSSGGLTRCRALSTQAGGKGANVVRALQALRSRNASRQDVLIGFAAGLTGRMFADLAAEESLTTALVICDGETRISTVLLTNDGVTTRLFEHGPVIRGTDEDALHAAVRSRPARAIEWAIVDGAVPPGSTNGFYATICRELREAGYRVLVDATGVQLVESLAARPDIVKVNLAEARSAVGASPCPCDDEGWRSGAEPAAEGLELCARLTAAGARDAIVTLGAAGAVALCAGKQWHILTPSISVRNAVGSGDCFAAALMVALEAGEPAQAALAAAAGVAAANAASPLTGHFDPALARELTALASVRPPAF